MCTVLLPQGVNPIAVNKYTNINKDAKYLAFPSTVQTDENVDQVKESIFKNRRISICDVANTEDGIKNSPIWEGHSFGWGSRTEVGSASSNSSVRAVFSVHHGMVWRTMDLYC